jgi:hypothetical protein
MLVRPFQVNLVQYTYKCLSRILILKSQEIIVHIYVVNGLTSLCYNSMIKG